MTDVPTSLTSPSQGCAGGQQSEPQGVEFAFADEHNFPLNRLIFETLENEHIDNYRHLTNILREYREFGFMTAIDDFGAGHSGLNLLADFQPDLIKLDMALIRDVDRDRVRQVIVRGLSQSVSSWALLSSPKASKVPANGTFYTTVEYF